jgi:hypothetical protein
MSRVFGALPAMTKPAINVPSPAVTFIRADTLMRREPSATSVS